MRQSSQDELRAEIIQHHVRRRGARRRRRPGAAGPAPGARGAACRGARERPVLELEDVARRRHRRRDGHRGRLARRCARARCSASQGSTATGSARWQRRSPASARSPPARFACSARRSTAQRRRSARSSAFAMSPTTASARGSCGGMHVDINLFLKRIGQHPFWRLGRIQRGEVERRASRSRPRVRRPHAGPEDARRHALGRQHPEAAARARAVVRPAVVVFNKPTYGLDLKTTHAVRDAIREHADERRHRARHLHRPRRAARALRPRSPCISRGRLVGLIDNGAGAAERIGELMVGGTADSRPPRRRHVEPGAELERRRAPRAAGPALGRARRCRRPLDRCRSCSRSSRAALLLAALGHEPVRVLPRRLDAAASRAALAGQRDPHGAAAADRRRADRDLPREHLEPRLRRPVPARRGARLGLRPVARWSTCRTRSRSSSCS